MLCRTLGKSTACILLRALVATALRPHLGSAQSLPPLSAAIPTTFPSSASSFPALPSACAATTPGPFPSLAPGTASSISLRSFFLSVGAQHAAPYLGKIRRGRSILPFFSPH